MERNQSHQSIVVNFLVAKKAMALVPLALVLIILMAGSGLALASGPHNGPTEQGGTLVPSIAGEEAHGDMVANPSPR